MSIFKRRSGNWAVVVDIENPKPFRIVQEMPNATNGRRQASILERFATRAEADRQLALLQKMGDLRALQIERLARGRRTIGTYKTKKEAEQAERAVLAAKDRNVDLVPSTIKMSELVSQYIRDRSARGRCGAKTIEEYERLLALYIEPHFRSLMVKKVRPAAVNSWISTLMESGGRGGKGLSAKSVRHAFTLLNAAMRWGMRMQLVGQNVCEMAEPPTAPRSKARALAANEMVTLLAAARGTRWEHFIGLALMLGARRGELLALSWDDVDLDAGRVIIRASLSQTKGTVEMKSTKTGRVRIVPLTLAARETFRRLHLQQSEDRLRAGELFQMDSRRPIFTDEFGKQISPKAATNGFARIAIKAGIGTTSLHSTRHTAATQLIAGGVDIRTTASILGHTTPNVTLSLYAHVVEGAERAAMDLLEGRLEKMRVHRDDASDEIGRAREWHAPATQATKKPRRSEVSMVAGTGFEPVTFGL